MLPTFVIGLREGVEVALIVGVIAAFLRQDPRGRGVLKYMWAGVAAAIGLCVAAGVALEILNQDLPQREQEGPETIIALLAVGVVTLMIVWMRKHARTIGKDLRSSAEGGVKLNLTRFFRITGIVLVFVAAGLVASALHTAHEAGWVNVGQAHAFDLDWLVVPGTWTASLLTGMLGLQPFPFVIEVAGYAAYAVPMLLFLLVPDRIRSRVARRGAHCATTAVLLVLVAGVLLAACGNSDDTSGTTKVAVKLTDAGCEPATLKIDAGPTTFVVTNGGTSRVSEFEILDGAKIIGERENIAAGLSDDFTLTLQPGNYTTACPGARTAATGRLTVGGSAVAVTNDSNLEAAVTGYQSYVKTQTKELITRVGQFAAAVKAGSVANAEQLFASARYPYEQIEPVAESFGDLDRGIDARVNDVARGDKWTGFHRIEQALWKDKTTKGMSPVADKLVADVARLDRLVQQETYQPAQLANGATELLGEVSKSKITGEEDRYSHTDLWDLEANVAGAETAFGLLAPALRKKDAALATNVAKRFDAVQAELKRIKKGGDYPSYDTVGTAQRRTFSQLVDALAEPLSEVAAKLHT